MKLTPLGKFVLLILVIGLAVGGWRLSMRHHLIGGALGGAMGGGGNTGGPDSGEPAGNDVQLLTSLTKKGWLIDEINKFNASNSGYHVTLRFMETRSAMHAILEGQAHPALWSPSSIVWADRLSDVWSQHHSDQIVDTSDNESYRVVFRSPIVFVTTKEKAAFLQPLLGGTDCWLNVWKLSQGKIRAPWGSFKWSHADPLNANSGMLTLALILSDYALRTGQSGAIDSLASSTQFATYLTQMERTLVFNDAVEKGSSALAASFANDPSQYDFITAYESVALDMASKNPDIAVIYPSPTANSESSIAVLNAPWVSPDQRAGAKAFLTFLSSPSSISDGVLDGLRPVTGQNLPPAIAANAGAGFAGTYAALELPPYDALNSAAVVWRVDIAHQPLS